MISGNSMNSKGFQQFMVNEELLQKVTEAVQAGEKQARSGGEIQSFEVFYLGMRQNIAIGRIYVVPPSVCTDRKNFPTALLYGCLVKEIGGEEMGDMIEKKIGESDFDEYSQLDFDSLKETLFGTEEGEYSSLVIYAPMWWNKREYIAFKFTKDEEQLKNNLRHQVFAAYYDPALSSAFDAIMTKVNTVKLDVCDITPKINFPFFSGSDSEYPDLQKKASRRKKIFFDHHNAAEIEQEILEPQELDVFESLDEALTNALMPEVNTAEEVAEVNAPDTNLEVPRLASSGGNNYQAIANALNKINPSYNASVEGGGASPYFIDVTLEDGSMAWGTADGETWCGDLSHDGWDVVGSIRSKVNANEQNPREVAYGIDKAIQNHQRYGGDLFESNNFKQAGFWDKAQQWLNGDDAESFAALKEITKHIADGNSISKEEIAQGDELARIAHCTKEWKKCKNPDKEEAKAAAVDLWRSLHLTLNNMKERSDKWRKKLTTKKKADWNSFTPDGKKDKTHPGELKDEDVIAAIAEKKWGTVTIPMDFGKPKKATLEEKADYIASHIAMDIEDRTEVSSPKTRKANKAREDKLAKNRHKQADVPMDIDSIWSDIMEEMGPAPQVELPKEPKEKSPEVKEKVEKRPNSVENKKTPKPPSEKDEDGPTSKSREKESTKEESTSKPEEKTSSDQGLFMLVLALLSILIAIKNHPIRAEAATLTPEEEKKINAILDKIGNFKYNISKYLGKIRTYLLGKKPMEKESIDVVIEMLSKLDEGDSIEVLEKRLHDVKELEPNFNEEDKWHLSSKLAMDLFDDEETSTGLARDEFPFNKFSMDNAQEYFSCDQCNTLLKTVDKFGLKDKEMLIRHLDSHGGKVLGDGRKYLEEGTKTLSGETGAVLEGEPISCDYCEVIDIDGTPVHENGCPNYHKVWKDGRWVRFSTCNECDEEIPEDEVQSHAEEHERGYFLDGEKQAGLGVINGETISNMYKNHLKQQKVKTKFNPDSAHCKNCGKSDNLHSPSDSSCPTDSDPGEGRIPMNASKKQSHCGVCGDENDMLDHGAKAELADNPEALKTVEPSHFASEEEKKASIPEVEEAIQDHTFFKESEEDTGECPHCHSIDTEEIDTEEGKHLYCFNCEQVTQLPTIKQAAAGDEMSEELPIDFGAGDLADIVLDGEEADDNF